MNFKKIQQIKRNNRVYLYATESLWLFVVKLKAIYVKGNKYSLAQLRKLLFRQAVLGESFFNCSTRQRACIYIYIYIYIYWEKERERERERERGRKTDRQMDDCMKQFPTAFFVAYIR